MKRIFPLLFALALPAAGGIVPGLEDFGSVTLVDSIDCANDTTHQFRDYPAGRSYTTNILGSSTRVMHHVRNEETSKGQRTGAYVSWRVGKGKNLVPNDPYLLVVDYPDDAPRTVTLFDFAMGARHGYHTGFTVGVSMSPQVSVAPCYESVAVPFSHEWKQLVEVVFPFEKSTQYNGGSRIPLSTEGFDVAFVLVSQDQATDSVGLAVRSIKLYRIDDYAAAKPEIHYPAGDAPRRHVTSREEMGDGDGLSSFTTPSDWYVGKARLMSMLAMDTWSKDLLEFGYLQTWGGNRRWGWGDNYYAQLIDAMTAEGHYLLPIYEYHGSRGDGNTSWDNGGSLGYDANYKPWTLESAKDASLKYKFSGQSYVYNCMADMTLPQTREDLEDLMDRTILQFKDRGNFLGAWIRTRGGMPVGFSDKTIALFNSDTDRNVTRAQIWNNGAYADTQLYKAYREWWYGKRRNLLAAVQSHLESGGLPGAKLFYHSTAGEDGIQVGQGVIESVESDTLYRGQTWRQMTGKNGTTSLSEMASKYKDGLARDGSNWGDVEACHATPHADPANYAALANVALSYPFNCIHTVASSDPAQNFRNASGDLLMARHYSLDEFCANDYNLESGQSIVGYYTSDMDHAGRAVMCAEVMAMAVNDPTILGYLFGSNLDRLDAPYVREFNLNFLSLPATTSTVLLGGTCSDPVTIRRWTTSAGNYWAVINTTARSVVSGSWNLQTSKTRVWRTVDWREEAVSGGKATFALEPYQMVCLTDVEPSSIVAPVIGEIDADPLAAHTATLSVALTSLGENATSATVAWTLSGGPAASSSGTLSYSATGAKTATLSGLAPDTVYTVALEATAAPTGKKALRSFSFKTPRFPVALGVPFAETDANGTAATATVTVLRADRDATLVLKAGGATVATWTGVVAGESYSASFAVALGVTKNYSFSLVHADPATGERYEATASGSVLGRKAVGWLDVQFDRAGANNWTTTSGVDGGTWTSGGGTNKTAFASDGGNNRLELQTGNDGYAAYTASAASHARYAVLVRGRAQFVSEPGAPDAPSDSPLAGLALGEEGGAVSLYGWTKDGWVRLAGAPVAENEWTDWNAAIDFSASPVTVTYGIGGTVLSNATTGAAALRVSGTPTSLRTVRYVGSGAADDFKGVYYEPVTIVAIREPEYVETTATTSPISFRTQGGTPYLDLSISVAGQPTSTQYTAFVCNTLDPDDSHWTAAAKSRTATSAEIAAGAVKLSVPSTPDTQFVKIVASDHSIAKGTKLSALGL